MWFLFRIFTLYGQINFNDEIGTEREKYGNYRYFLTKSEISEEKRIGINISSLDLALKFGYFKDSSEIHMRFSHTHPKNENELFQF